MKMPGGVRHSRLSVTGPARRRSGFTLIEVLVVLSILVILFSLLFAPIIASLDMVTLGHSRVQMQDAARTAMEQMRREISNAMYVFPTPIIRLPGADTTINTGDDRRVPDYSQIVFVAPARDSSGRVVDPPAPRTDATGSILAVRFRASLLDEAQAYSDSNSFVLVREEGYYTWNAATGMYDFAVAGGTNPARTLLTPRASYDIPVTTSICRTCETMVAGYVETCTACASTDIAHLHGNMQFRPERVTGELLQASNDATLYRSRHAAWDGFDNAGNILLQDIVGGTSPATLGFCELDPRIVVYRSTDMYVRRDSYSTSDFSNIYLTWNSEAGAIQVGAVTPSRVQVTNPNAAIVGGAYYALDCAGDGYDAAGSRAGAQTSDLVPVYPVSTLDGDPAMPVAYIVDPTMGGNEPHARIVPGSVQVRVVAQDAGGQRYQTAYTETSNTNQAEIGRRQFAVVLSDHNQRGEVRFNELAPPSPRLFDGDDLDWVPDITLSTFDIYIRYYFRRNYDASQPDNDDIIKVDYSTRRVMNLGLTLQRYYDPEPDPDNSAVLIIPADATPDRVSVQDQAKVRNLGR